MRVIDAVRVHGLVEAARVLETTPEDLKARWRLAKLRIRHRRAQAKYQRTAKGKATAKKYNDSAAGRAAHDRYEQSARGRQQVGTLNARRIYIGCAYQGRAATVEHAAVIRKHIQQRVHAFTRQQARAETESAQTRAVSPQAKP